MQTSNWWTQQFPIQRPDHSHKGPVIIYQLGGGGGDWAILGGSWKKFYPKWGGQNFIYESIGGGSQIWFPFPFLASKCSGFWGAKPPRPPLLSLFFASFMPHFSPSLTKNGKHEEIFICWDALSQILLWQCTPSLDHTQVQTFYKVYIVSNFSYTKGQLTTPPPNQKCHCSMSGNRKL